MNTRRVALVLMTALLALVAGATWVAPLPHARLIVDASRREAVDPMLVAAVIRTESGFRPTVVSKRGAVGLMQVMPDTAGWVVSKIHGPSRLTDPVDNVRSGTWYLAYLLGRYHQNRILALAAYNSGPEVVDGWLRTGAMTPTSPPSAIPYPATRAFVERVLWLTSLYRVVYGGVGNGGV